MSRIRYRCFHALASGLQENVRSESEEQMMNLFGWINLAFGLLAAFVGVIVLRGVFKRTLSSASTVRFLRWSLVASLAGLMPLTHHLSPVQQTCMVSVYCSGAAIIAWLKFDLVGRSRRIFALSVTAVLYFDIVFVATRIFRNPPLFTARLAQPLPFFQFVQIFVRSGFHRSWNRGGQEVPDRANQDARARELEAHTLNSLFELQLVRGTFGICASV